MKSLLFISRKDKPGVTVEISENGETKRYSVDGDMPTALRTVADKIEPKSELLQSLSEALRPETHFTEFH